MLRNQQVRREAEQGKGLPRTAEREGGRVD